MQEIPLEGSAMRKICFICDTPFQVMNAVLLWQRMREKCQDLCADIYIGDQFQSCRDISERLKKIRIFHEIVRYDIPKSGIYALKAVQYLQKINMLFFAKAMMNKRMNRPIMKNEYSELYCSFFAMTQSVMRFFNPDALLYYFEDGTGTYVGDYQLSKFCRAKRLTYKLIQKPFPNFTPTRFYVNSPLFFSLLQKDFGIVPEQLPLLRPEDTETVNLLLQLFDFHKNPLYDERRIVYLTQPYENTTKGCEESVLEVLKAFQNDIVLKVHPRQRNNAHYRSFAGDWKGEFWELVALLQITDNHILLSPFSTAQISPKIMFDKEPWLIFMAPIWYGTRDLPRPKERKLIDALRSIYRNPEKIMVARDVPELLGHLEQILQERKAIKTP